MFMCDLKSRLAEIDDKLYVKEDAARHVRGVNLSGVYYRTHRRGLQHVTDNLCSADKDAQHFMRACAAGDLDAFICGIPLSEIPEYDQFNLDEGRLICCGWRTLALSLVRQGVCSLDRVRKVFESSSLGESDYDRMDFHKRLELARSEADATRNTGIYR